MKKQLALLVTGLLVAMTTIASAGNKAETFSISPVIGGYLFDGKQHLKTNVIYGARAGYNFTDAFGVEALFDYLHNNDSTLGPKPGISMFRYGGELLYHFIPENSFVPYVAAGYAGVNFDSNSDGISNKGYKQTRGAFDYGVGAKYFLNDNFALRADVRHLIYKYDQTYNNLEYTVGAYIPFGGTKPAVKPVEPPPAPAPTPLAAPLVVPPPAPPAAPTAALLVTPATVIKGQSAILNWKSENASGCEIQPGIGPVPPEGVRTITPSVSTSYNLECSGAGGTATTAAGVTVVLPPPPAPAPVTPKAAAAAERFCNKPAVLEINFDTNKTNIKPKYHDELKTVGDFLMYFPNAKGEISGHTDTVGSKAHNLILSQARADSVKKYIVKTFGIEAARIDTKGYGFSKPVASNKTKAGKAKNRRIEANFTCE